MCVHWSIVNYITWWRWIIYTGPTHTISDGWCRLCTIDYVRHALCRLDPQVLWRMGIRNMYTRSMCAMWWQLVPQVLHHVMGIKRVHWSYIYYIMWCIAKYVQWYHMYYITSWVSDVHTGPTCNTSHNICVTGIQNPHSQYQMVVSMRVHWYYVMLLFVEYVHWYHKYQISWWVWAVYTGSKWRPYHGICVAGVDTPHPPYHMVDVGCVQWSQLFYIKW